MPELPEVETVRRQLESLVVGRQIKAIEVRFAGRLNLPAKKFISTLIGKKLLAVRRRSKLLLLDFSGGWTIACHLKMTGRWLLVAQDTTPTKHAHLVFHLSKNQDLWFEDTRKFGYLKLLPTKDVEEDILKHHQYGPEPLEKSFDLKTFSSCIAKGGKAKIKPLLMNPMCIAGIGNIYADESCFDAQIRPDRPANSLTSTELSRLYRGLQKVLTRSLAVGGTSSESYLDVYGHKGGNVPLLKVYGRDGKKCKRCGHVISKTRLAGRGTHFCEKCQK